MDQQVNHSLTCATGTPRCGERWYTRWALSDRNCSLHWRFPAETAIKKAMKNPGLQGIFDLNSKFYRLCGIRFTWQRLPCLECHLQVTSQNWSNGWMVEYRRSQTSPTNQLVLPLELLPKLTRYLCTRNEAYQRALWDEERTFCIIRRSPEIVDPASLNIMNHVITG